MKPILKIKSLICSETDQGEIFLPYGVEEYINFIEVNSGVKEVNFITKFGTLTLKVEVLLKE